MDAVKAAQVSGIVRLVVNDPEVRRRLRPRPDWRDSLERRLIDLGDAFPSYITFAVCFPRDEVPTEAQTKLSLVPRLPRISTTPLYVDGLGEVYVENGELLRVEGNERVPVRSDERPVLFDPPPPPPVPGHTVVTLCLPVEYSREELDEVVNRIYKDHQVVREWQLARGRSAELARLEELQKELADSGADPGEARQPDADTMLREVDRRIAELKDDATRNRRMRLSDRLFFDLWCVREFLRGATIADIVRTWNRRPAAPADIVARHAFSDRVRGLVDRDGVERSLRRWLGEELGPNPNVRPDPRAPCGYRLFPPAQSG